MLKRVQDLCKEIRDLEMKVARDNAYLEAYSDALFQVALNRRLSEISVDEAEIRGLIRELAILQRMIEKGMD